MRVRDMQDEIEPNNGKQKYNDGPYKDTDIMEYSEEGECCAYKKGGGYSVGGFLKRNNFGDRI